MKGLFFLKIKLMKFRLTLIILFCVQLITNAQEDYYTIRVDYLTTIDWEIPKSYQSTLYINDSKSVFIFKTNNKDNILENTVDRTFHINIGSEIPNFYINNNQHFICSEQIFNKNFIVKDTNTKIEWNLTNDTKLINTFLCKKAVGYFRGRTYNAWFTEKIPINKGPWKLSGLPGLIVEVSDNLNEVRFELISIKSINEKIEFDIRNKKQISWREYKLKETKKIKDVAAFMESLSSGNDVTIKTNSTKSIEKYP